jgi:hypothetical protein
MGGGGGIFVSQFRRAWNNCNVSYSIWIPLPWRAFAQFQRIPVQHLASGWKQTRSRLGGWLHDRELYFNESWLDRCCVLFRCSKNKISLCNHCGPSKLIWIMCTQRMKSPFCLYFGAYKRWLHVKSHVAKLPRDEDLPGHSWLMPTVFLNFISFFSLTTPGLFPAFD